MIHSRQCTFRCDCRQGDEQRTRNGAWYEFVVSASHRWSAATTGHPSTIVLLSQADTFTTPLVNGRHETPIPLEQSESEGGLNGRHTHSHGSILRSSTSLGRADANEGGIHDEREGRRRVTKSPRMNQAERESARPEEA